MEVAAFSNGVKKHKAMKGLQTQNLRDHMSEAAEMFYVMKQKKPFDHERFVEALNRLPEIPG